MIATALAAVYIVLGILYESYIHPVTILSTLPSAGVGALLALELTHTDLSIIAIIGIILLIGIVKKNAILMIDFAIAAERNEGKSSRDAIFEAGLLRFRPILMTTMAAMLGALPLALGTGHRVGIAASARNHHHWRPALQPDAYPLHDACGLSLLRPAAAMASKAAGTAASALPGRRAHRLRGVNADVSTMFTATVSSTQSDSLTLALAGHVSYEALPEIALLIDHGRRDHEKVILDLSEVTLLDPAAAQFFAEQFRGGVRLVNCPVYIRRWIVRDTNVEAEADE